MVENEHWCVDAYAKACEFIEMVETLAMQMGMSTDQVCRFLELAARRNDKALKVGDVVQHKAVWGGVSKTVQ